MRLFLAVYLVVVTSMAAAALVLVLDQRAGAPRGEHVGREADAVVGDERAVLSQLTRLQQQVAAQQRTMQELRGELAALSAAPTWDPHDDPIVSLWNVGSGFDMAEGAWSGPYYMEGHTWQSFIAEHIEREYAWGCRRWFIHLPFGRPPDREMEFDAPLHCPDQLMSDFTEAWAAFLQAHPDVQVIAYYGRFDESWDRLTDDEWHERATRSLAPLPDGMDLAIDASSSLAPHTRGFALMQREQRKRRVYCEAWPTIDTDLDQLAGAICATKRWRYVQQNPDAFLAPAQLKHAIQLINSNFADYPNLEDDPQAMRQHVHSAIADGQAAAIHLRELLDVITREELLTQLSAGTAKARRLEAPLMNAD